MAEKLPSDFRIRFVIDGFDECDTEDRPRLMDLLNIIRLVLYPVHILLATRPEVDIERHLKSETDFTHLNMDKCKDLRDIQLYIRRKVEEISELGFFREKINATMPDKSEGVF